MNRLAKLSYIASVLLFNCFAFGQSNAEILQREAFKHGNDFLGINTYNACTNFRYGYKQIPDSELGVVCFRKFDSLRTILRREFLDTISGKWRGKNVLIDYDVVDSTSQKNNILLIDQTGISFYKQNKKKDKLLSTQKWIIDNKLQPLREHFEFVLDEKSFVAIYTNPETQHIYVKVIGTLDDNGNLIRQKQDIMVEYERFLK
jgi:hypothetical protein